MDYSYKGLCQSWARKEPRVSIDHLKDEDKFLMSFTANRKYDCQVIVPVRRNEMIDGLVELLRVCDRYPYTENKFDRINNRLCGIRDTMVMEGCIGAAVKVGRYFGFSVPYSGLPVSVNNQVRRQLSVFYFWELNEEYKKLSGNFRQKAKYVMHSLVE